MTMTVYVQPLLDREDRLVDLATSANDEHIRVLGSLDDALYHANQAGKALREARELILNGQRKSKGGAWTKWIAKNFRGNQSTAYLYMNVAGHYDELVARRESLHAMEGSWNYQRALREIANPNPSEPESDEAWRDDPANQPGEPEPEPESDELEFDATDPEEDDSNPEPDPDEDDDVEAQSDDGLTDDEIEDLHEAGHDQDLVRFLLAATGPTEKLRGYSVQMIAEAVLAESDATRDRFLRQVPQIAAFWQDLAVALETKGELKWAR